MKKSYRHPPDRRGARLGFADPRGAARVAATTGQGRIILPIASIILCTLILFPGCESKDPSFPSAPTAGLLTIQNVSSHVFGILQFRIQGTDQWSRNYLSGPIGLNSELYYYFPVGNLDFRFESTDGSATWTYERTIDENNPVFIVLSD